MSDNKNNTKKHIEKKNDTTDADDINIIKLESKLEKERDARKEERFVWILTTMILFDMFVFQTAQTWGFPIAILVLQVILLTIMAIRLGVDKFIQLLDKFLDSFKKN